MYSVKKIVQVIKSITAREVFQRCPQVKKRLWGGEFWSDGYFASTVGKHGDEAKIGKYVQSQGQTYKKLHEDRQSTNTPQLAAGIFYSDRYFEIGSTSCRRPSSISITAATSTNGLVIEYARKIASFGMGVPAALSWKPNASE